MKGFCWLIDLNQDSCYHIPDILFDMHTINGIFNGNGDR